MPEQRRGRDAVGQPGRVLPAEGPEGHQQDESERKSDEREVRAGHRVEEGTFGLRHRHPDALPQEGGLVEESRRHDGGAPERQVRLPALVA